jgi:hypothetical protein
VTLTSEQEPPLLLPVHHGPGGGITGSSRGDRDLSAGCLAGIGERRQHETEPQPGPHERHDRGGERPLAAGRLARTCGAGEGAGRRRRPQAPSGGSEEARRAGQAAGSHPGLSGATRRTVAADASRCMRRIEEAAARVSPEREREQGKGENSRRRGEKRGDGAGAAQPEVGASGGCVAAFLFATATAWVQSNILFISSKKSLSSLLTPQILNFFINL